MNDVPDSVWSTVLSRSSLKNWTCGAISEPNVAVAMRQPPPSAVGTAGILNEFNVLKSVDLFLSN